MLGIRLSAEAEARSARDARETGCSKSILARDWILERLARKDIDDKIRNAAKLDAEERARIVREPETSAGKARTCVVVQRESALGTAVKVTVCPPTSRLRGPAGQRPFVMPDGENRRRLPSEVEVDWIFTHPVEAVGDVIGRLDTPTLEAVDVALRRWFDL